MKFLVYFISGYLNKFVVGRIQETKNVPLTIFVEMTPNWRGVNLGKYVKNHMYMKVLWCSLLVHVL